MSRLARVLQAWRAPASDPVRHHLEAAVPQLRADIEQAWAERAEIEGKLTASEARLATLERIVGHLGKLAGTTDPDALHGTVLAWKMTHDRAGADGDQVLIPRDLESAIGRLIAERNRLAEQVRSVNLCPIRDWYGAFPTLPKD